MRTFDDQCVIINPNVDASDKEVFIKNGCKTAGKNLVCFLQNGDQADFLQGVYRPSRFGELTKDNLGVVHQLGSDAHEPKFKENGQLKGVLAGMNNSQSHMNYSNGNESAHNGSLNNFNKSTASAGILNSLHEGGNESFIQA
mgnify:CR=1 FL=1